MLSFFLDSMIHPYNHTSVSVSLSIFPFTELPKKNSKTGWIHLPTYSVLSPRDFTSVYPTIILCDVLRVLVWFRVLILNLGGSELMGWIQVGPAQVCVEERSKKLVSTLYRHKHPGSAGWTWSLQETLLASKFQPTIFLSVFIIFSGPLNNYSKWSTIFFIY